ncbi:MAG: hypothetical protein K1W36_04205, partial [Lachnospiraceae bacterium]
SGVEESSSSEESSEVEESSSTEESSEVEESSSSTEESSSIEESSSTEESSKVEESSSTEESSSEKETSPYTDKERTDLRKSDGKIAPIKAKTYDGSAYTPAVKVTVAGSGKSVTLTEGADYSVEYKNNVNAGTGTVIVRGNGIYKGQLKASFTINPKSVKSLKAYADDMTVGSKSEPAVYIFDGAKRLTKGTDYTLKYDRGMTGSAKKSAQVEIVAKGNYKDSKTVKLAVYKSSESKHFISASLAQTQFAYTGKAIKPGVTVISPELGTGELRLNKDYKVQYRNNVNAGTAYVIVTGKGQYQGKTVVTFEITPRDAADTMLTISRIPDKTYNGKLQKPSVTVKNGKKKLVKNKDYTVSYTGNLHASTDSRKAKVIITGKGNYAGITAEAKFTIKPQKISRTTVKGTKEKLTVSYGKTTLKEGVHYTVTPDASVAKGNKVKIKITGLGDFAGSEVSQKVKLK